MSEVLVVDDQVPLLDALGESLRGRGYDVEFATNGGQALALIRQHVADAVILDLDLPDVGGMEVLNSIRDWTAVPVIALSTRTAEIQKVAALDAGADDYITKPFDMDELMARLRVVLRGRRCGTCEPVITTEHFTIDLAARQVARDGRTVPLTRTEWEIVALLARHPGCLISQQRLMAEVWGMTDVGHSSYIRIRVFLLSIRRKLEPESAKPRYFITEHGFGVRFLPERNPRVPP